MDYILEPMELENDDVYGGFSFPCPNQICTNDPQPLPPLID